MTPHDPTPPANDRAANAVFGASLLIIAAIGVSLLPASPVPSPHVEKTTESADTPPVLPSDAAPVLEPREALAALRTAPGVRASIAVHEPAIGSPVAAAFDEDGRLWVAEMRTYMRDLDATGEEEPRNRVVIFEDVDGDGSFEKSTVFMDDVALPRGIAPCFGGILLLEPPSIYFCKDTNGDGRADIKQRLLDGFTGLDNPEHAANSLVYGLDNWYHLSQHSLDFRFDGRTVETRPTPSIGQWGLAQDTQGRMYTTPNSDPLLIDLLPRHYGARNPNDNQPAFLGRSIVADKSVYPIRSTPGVNRGYQENVLRADQTLKNATAACGPVLYDADFLGAGMRGSAFVCEPAGNVVKRYIFTEKDAIPVGANPYQASEFLASSDERFRPVNTLVGPDGALYVLDMYRGIIQHKLFLTPYLRQQILSRSLQSPVDRGRIYRITGENASPTMRRHLAAASNTELVKLLAHDDQWWRLTAQRLLVERRAVDVAALIRELAQLSTSGAVRLHALWTLDGIGAINAEDIRHALGNAEPAVRAATLRIAERFLADESIVELLEQHAQDPDKWVRVQAVCSLGELQEQDRIPRLAAVLKSAGSDRYMRDAALSGLASLELPMLQELTQDETWAASKDARPVLDDLSDCLLRAGDDVRADFIEFTASVASDQHPAAETLIRRIRVAQKLDSEKPRPIGLSRAPSRWIGAMGERFNAHAALMTDSEVYFDWPDRPPVRRVHGTRPLTSREHAQFERGRVLYSQTCISCHHADGRGASGLAPSMVGSSIVEGPSERLASVLIHGLEGTWHIGQMSYEAAMPPTTIVGDEDLAAVMTFVRRSFGNAADPVKAEEVTQARTAYKDRRKPWTRAEVNPPPAPIAPSPAPK